MTVQNIRKSQKVRPKKNNLLVSFDSTQQRKSPDLRTSKGFNSHCASRDALTRNDTIQVGNSAKEVRFNDDQSLNEQQSTTLVGWNKDDQFSNVNSGSRQNNYNQNKSSNKRASTITINVHDQDSR